MGYLPASPRGIVHVGPDAPTAKPGIIWFDVATGIQHRFDERMEQWLPVGVASPAYGGNYGATSYGDADAAMFAVAVGTDAQAASGGVALGYHVNAQMEAVAVGHDARALDTASVAIGKDAQASIGEEGNTPNAVAVGFKSQAVGGYDVAIGNQAISHQDYAVAIGSNAQTGTYSVAIGPDARAGVDSSMEPLPVRQTTALGAYAAAQGDQGTAVGTLAQASGVDSLAAGATATALGARSVAIGRGASASADDQAVLRAHELVVEPHDVGTPTVPGAATSLVLFSPNGKRWRISVSDTGTLGATEVL